MASVLEVMIFIKILKSSMTIFLIHASSNNDTIQWFESQEIMPSNQIQELDKIADRAKMFICGDVEIGHVTSNTKWENFEFNPNNMIKLAEQEHSDLVEGRYEGGLKIWECTSDLIAYLEENRSNINFEGKRVLDLGCGAGILGIYAFMNGSKVTFQDYNKEVIECATIPNILLNTEEDEREAAIKKCKFYTGDWASYNQKCDEVFDIILTSETIYNERNYGKLLEVLLEKLNINGIAYFAAKTYYFGVGGGTRQFEQTIKNNGTLESEVCWKSSGGIQREILRIKKTQS